jgi:uncharacterized membrane protein YjgN (DUF898 family)
VGKSKNFVFDGGAATFFGTAVLAAVITVFTLGICYPYSLVLMQRWKAKHTYIKGLQLKFTGTGIGLLGQWIKWFLLCLITLGIYGFWVYPRLQQWIVEHTDFSGRRTELPDILI